jgi:hypothetical protein
MTWTVEDKLFGTERIRERGVVARDQRGAAPIDVRAEKTDQLSDGGASWAASWSEEGGEKQLRRGLLRVLGMLED